jgi:CelD/BcsL family acetyltransferase involved in cellulose biosynthesis
MTGPVSIEVFESFEVPELKAAWNGLVFASPDPLVFMTWEWQRAWWEVFGRGQLLIVAAKGADGISAIAPLFAEAGMIYLIGSGGSDYLDLVGAPVAPSVASAMLDEAAATASGFLGCVFYHLPTWQQSDVALREAATSSGLAVTDEGTLVAPLLDLRAAPETAVIAAAKKSLVRHERFFAREGELVVTHTTSPEEIAPQLDGFFAQHAERWADTPYPSLFTDPSERAFYRELVRRVGPTGWLRFTTVWWDDRPIAFHFGTCFAGRYLWYKPSFAIDLARRSPGEVLIRQLLLAAIAEGATVFDFGLGDEAFKQRFATHTRFVRTVGAYPAHVVAGTPRP